MTNYIRKMSGKQYMKRLAENPTVIIPTGACEIYGPQLPMGSDLIAAKRIAELVAEKTGALIAPTIEARFFPMHIRNAKKDPGRLA